MRFERFWARAVLALGVCTMLATSDEDWSAGATDRAVVQSQGEGDDKLVRLRFTITGGLRRDYDEAYITLTGKVNRPASDVRFQWSESSPVVPDPWFMSLFDAGPADTGVGDASADDASSMHASSPSASIPSSYDDGFTTVILSGFLLPWKCPVEGVACDALVEARVMAGSVAPYSMELKAGISLSGGASDRPKGSVRVTMEVIDAP